ncbi:MAG: hypothetical protein DPW16_01695 [Chloroflexi bacterium]|nr:hypothetical protein [Chloroflexota bacterium]
MMFNYYSHDLKFHPQIPVFLSDTKNKPLVVLAGPNNSGKSLLLKSLKQKFGRTSYLIGVNRFYHVYHFSSGLRDPNEIDSFETQFNSQFGKEQYNFENNFFDLHRVIVGLSNSKRDTLLQLCGDLLGNMFTLKRVDPDNDLSVSYIDMDGQNISVGSTGTRLLMTMLGICMDERFSKILIDEPELGLSPKVQQAFAEFLQGPENRDRYFPHLHQVFLATHSHIFLNRQDIQSNYIVSKDKETVDLAQTASINDFHRLQFNLLGNSLEMMYFPAAIVIVEGKTDLAYIDRLLQLRFLGRRLTVISSSGDVKRKVAGLREAFGDLSKSPYRNRLFVVLDQVHQPGLVAELENMGIESENIIRWDRNGIEYVYPVSIMAELFSCTPNQLDQISIREDRIELNGIVKTKTELLVEIMKRLDSRTPLPKEMETKLLDPINAAIS